MAETAKRRHFDEEFKRRAVRMLLKSNKPVSSFAAAIGVERTNLHRWLNRYGAVCGSDKTPRRDGSVGLDDFISLKREVDSMKETIRHLRTIVKHSLADKYKNDIER